ncbi:DNA primase [Chloroflexota bacterium]
MSTIDEIKQRLDIVDVISAYLGLDKAGRNFKANCPFHQEKTPSFIVFPERQSWRCFGCGAGGDLFSFVMKKEGVDFGDALKLLADKAGVPLVRKKEVAQDKRTERLHQVNEAAARYYHNLLLQGTRAKLAQEYVKLRGLTTETITAFQLGFSTGEGLRRHLVEQGYGEGEILAAGLAVEKEGKTRDFLRRRLIFPIRDIKGRVVGFGGRALDESLVKYINTPQTAVFDKGGVLYGIDHAAEAIREQKLAVIVEGYMDVITAHQNGITNVVASMGTALTEKQIRVLKRLTKSLAFALDPDVAGSAATLRGIEIARRSLEREDKALPGLLGSRSKLKAEIKVVPLPQGEDPDALIKKDAQSFRQMVDHGLPLLEYLLTVVAKGSDLTKPQGKSEVAEQLLPLIAELEDDVERELYFGKLAALVGISEKTLLGMSARMHRTRREQGTSKELETPFVGGDRLEEYCLSLLLQHPELRNRTQELLPDHFERSENREAFLAWRDVSASEELSVNMHVDLKEHFQALAGKVIPPLDIKELEVALGDCIRRLEERRLRIQEEFLTQEAVSLVSAGESLDSAILEALQQKTIEVDTRLSQGMPGRSRREFVPGEDK